MKIQELHKEDDLSNTLDDFDWMGLVFPPIPWIPLEEEEKEEKILKNKKKIKYSYSYANVVDDEDECLSLNAEEERHCYLHLMHKIDVRKNTLTNLLNREKKLLEVYEESKRFNKKPIIHTSLFLPSCCYKLNRTTCVLCDKELTYSYLINPSKCVFHVTCRKCFIFTQTMLCYFHLNVEIQCPLQRLGTNCHGAKNLNKCIQ